MDDLPSVERGPRQSDDESQTGTGTPRSADVGITEGPHERDGAEVVKPNRSGSGGSGRGTASMDELLGGDGPQDDAH